MEQNEKKKSPARDELVAALEKQINVQDRIIKAQETTIKAQEEHIAGLQKILDSIFNS